MNLIAALMWKKHPRCSISTMILDSDNVHIIAKPNIHYLTSGYLRFRRDSKQLMKDFFAQVESVEKKYKQPVTIEYKIVFHAPHTTYISPSPDFCQF